MNNIDEKINDGIKWGGIALLSSVLVGGFIGIPTDNMTVFFVISALCLCGWAFFFYVKISEYYEKYNKELYEKFYKECEKENIKNIHNSFQAQKAVLIAKKLNMKKKEYSNIISLYEKAQKNILDEKQRALLKQQQQEFDALNKYSNLYGRDKRIKMLTDLQNAYEQKSQLLHNASLSIVNASQQKEIDWALHGGIASGLAGGAAGIATALDNQLKNAQIREQNKANLKAVSHSVLKYEDASMDYSTKASDIQSLIDKAKVKVISDIPHTEVMKYLSFSNTTVDISETKSFTVNTTVKTNSSVEIMGEKAVVDGTVIATMYQNGNKVGSAVLVFPVLGVDSKAQLKGMCIHASNIIPNEPYDIKFEASKNLWIMEK